MLAKTQRFNLHYPENASILQRGNSQAFHGKSFLLLVRSSEKPLRVVVLTPKKHFRLAVERHYYQRLVYALLEKKLDFNKTGELVFLWQKKLFALPISAPQKKELVQNLSIELDDLFAKIYESHF